jgi:hypothetical protein
VSSIILFLLSWILAPSEASTAIVEENMQNNADAFNKIAMITRIMPTSKETEDRS